MTYRIKEKDWKQIYSVLKGIKAIHSQNESKIRLFVEAAYYMLKSGCQWRLLPPCYGNWRTINTCSFSDMVL